MTPVRGRRGDRGSALVEFTWLAIILIIPLIWIVMSVFEVQRGAFGVSGGARAAGRAYSLAPDHATGEARARQAVRLALADQGLEGQAFDVTIACDRPGIDGTCFSGGAVVTVRVATQVDLPMLPAILGGDSPSFHLDGTHTVPYGTYQE